MNPDHLPLPFRQNGANPPALPGLQREQLVKRLIMSATQFIDLLKVASQGDGITMRAEGIPGDANIVGIATDPYQPGLFVIFLTSATWVVPLVPEPIPPELKIQVTLGKLQVKQED